MDSRHEDRHSPKTSQFTASSGEVGSGLFTMAERKKLRVR